METPLFLWLKGLGKEGASVWRGKVKTEARRLIYGGKVFNSLYTAGFFGTLSMESDMK